MEVDVTILDNTIYVVTDETGRVTVTGNNPSTGQTAIQFQDEGVNLGTQGTVDRVNFVGSGVSVARNGDGLTVTVTSGGGSGDVVGPSGATGDNIAVFDGATGKLIKDGGTTIANITAVNSSASLFFLVLPQTTQAITNQPVAETFFISSNRHTLKFDATRYSAARLICEVQVASASANSPRLYPKWKTTFDPATTLVGDFTTLGTGLTTQTCSLAAVACAVSDWITLPAGAKADVFWCVAEIGGDATADPTVSYLTLQFRV